MVTGILLYTTTRNGEIWEGTNLELISVKPVRLAKIKIVYLLKLRLKKSIPVCKIRWV